MQHNYLAHSENKIRGDVHLLKDHLRDTSLLAESLGRNDKDKRILKLLGYIHDLGKYRDDFQRYIHEGGQRGSVRHAIYGASLAYSKKVRIATFCIAGHHNGIPDKSRLINDLHDNDIKGDVKYLEGLFQKDVIENLSDLIPNLGIDSLGDALITETYIRFLFSCLVDADWLDTEAHFRPDKYQKRIIQKHICKTTDFGHKISLLDEYIYKLSDKGQLNFLRNIARKQANRSTDKPVGFYSLSLPTGLGKTLCSVSWALRHAISSGLKRIIIVLPYTSIIDQTAKLLKEIFGDKSILEHHSNFEYKDNNEYSYEKLSTENWDFPFIVTTSVQFFESVFSNKPSKCRRVHNIADSVVIFDEVQTFAQDKFLPTLTMLKNLKEVFNVSFLFCTATQPAFASRSGFKGIDDITPLIAEPQMFYDKTKRVEYSLFKNLKCVKLRDIAEQINNMSRSTLVVFNTKKDTIDLYEQLAENFDVKYHLSTAMCPLHRKSKISEIKCQLRDRNKKIVVCSTQLIEAGVDLDFPIVFRALAPLDSIIQSAGRCNREGQLPDKGKVYIFKLLEQKYPQEIYKMLAEFTETYLSREGLDVLNSYKAYTNYFEELDNFIQWDIGDIERLRRGFLFEQVAHAYKIIDTCTRTVVVPYKKEEGDSSVSKLSNKPVLSKDDYRKLQLYSVQMYPHQFEKALHSGLIEQSKNGLFFIWIGKYSDDKGIVFDTTDPKI